MLKLLPRWWNTLSLSSSLLRASYVAVGVAVAGVIRDVDGTADMHELRLYMTSSMEPM